MTTVAKEFRIGFTEDTNKRYRRTMEDSHNFIFNFMGQPGSGYFAIFDGHAGKFAAAWCGDNLHDVLLSAFYLISM
jgi:protein phosphatase PTC1